jgi:hypothetical protein
MPIEHFIEVETNYGDKVLIPIETVFGWLRDERERVLANFQMNYLCMRGLDGGHDCNGWRWECDSDEDMPTFEEVGNLIMNPEI